jgi:hypothetical protein
MPLVNRRDLLAERSFRRERVHASAHLLQRPFIRIHLGSCGFVAPSAIDTDYFFGFIRDISVRNVEFSCSALRQLVTFCNNFWTADVLPLLVKLATFLKATAARSSSPAPIPLLGSVVSNR